MFGFLMGNGLWQLVRQSDAMTMFVLFMLLIMSIVCWAIFFYKTVLLYIKKRHVREIIQHLKNIDHFEGLKTLAATCAHTIPGYFLGHNISFLNSVLGAHGDHMMLNENELMLFQDHVDQTLDEIMHHEQMYLPVLSTSAAVAPLLGLFGTVWGLVHAFVSISQQQTADITTIAPGIAEALVTTLAGLMVAIPALMMYHYLNTQVRHIERGLSAVSDNLSFYVQRIFCTNQG